MADDYDFQINTLKFRAAASDRFPYERGTASFRKEQFDAAPTVGDQSLAGWWTRGQLSFHKGAGVKYLDLQQGDVLNTFWYGKDVRVMRAGEVQPVYTEAATDRKAITARGGRNIVQIENLDTFAAFGWIDSGTQIGRVWNGTGTISALSSTTLTHTDGILAYEIAAGDEAIYFGMEEGSIQQYTGSSTTGYLAEALDSFGPCLAIAADIGRRRVWTMNQDFSSSDKAHVLMVSMEGSGLTLADALGEIYPDPAGSWMAVCPEGCLIASGRKIFLCSVNEDGTGAPPVQVAETTLPITAMTYHSGQVVFATKDGLRIGELTGNSLVYGPAFGPTDDNNSGYHNQLSVWQMTGYAGMVYAGANWYVEQTPGTFTPYTGVIQINLNDQEDLVAAWSPWVVNEEGGSAASRPTYVCRFREGIAYTYNGNFEKRPTGTATAVSQITTGYHRFGTLEPKRFYTVTVKAQGLRGSIAVSAISATGTVTALGTLTITHTGSVQLVEQSFSMPTALAERFALRFTWASDGTTVAPTLVGYQLRALPAPTRQRILRWPLLIQDNVKLRRGVTVGKKGRAYSDLTALEALESSAAVVTYTDHRTGETGTAYVDAVEFQADTPSSDNTTGFGGVAYVTLRVLA